MATVILLLGQPLYLITPNHYHSSSDLNANSTRTKANEEINLSICMYAYASISSVKNLDTRHLSTLGST